MDSEGRKVIICDNGTGYIKCGFSSSMFPDIQFPCMVGRPLIRSRNRTGLSEIQDIMIGDEAQNVRHLLDVKYPVENGIVADWDDMKLIYQYLFGPKKLKITPKDSKILLTEAPLNPVKNRRAMLEVMLDYFEFHQCSLAYQAILTLYAQGVITGVVVDIGDGVTHICPVIDGYCIQKSIARLNVAGRDITRYLVTLLLKRGYVFNQSSDFHTVQQIKEQLCYVAHDLDQERQLALETTVLTEHYTLPDGRTIKISSERFEAPEVLFQPSLIGLEVPGVSEQLFKVINSLPMDSRPLLYKHIILSGGTTMYPGFTTRLQLEMQNLYQQRILKAENQEKAAKFINVETSPKRKYMVFLGGAVFAETIKDVPTAWISRKDYHELGPERCSELLDRICPR